MKKKILALALAISMTFGLCGCGDMETTTMVAGSSNASEQEPEKISFLADFYDNHGDMWLSVEGTSFSISPNKIKEYYFDTDGDWTYHYTMSSIMSIDIDGQSVESCGSTVIFADSRLEKFNIDIPKEITSSTGTTATVETPTDLSAEDWLTLDWWWRTKDLENKTYGSKIVIIQSQEGDNICVYCGDEVTWDIPKNLPKTTAVTIDGMPLFIHRANFAIIDKELLNKAGN